MMEQGLKVDSKQLYSLTEMLYINLEAIAEKVRREIIDYGYINIDETPGKILKSNTRGYIWSITNKYGAYFQIETTRSGKVALEMLKGFEGRSKKTMVKVNFLILDHFSGGFRYY